MARETLVKMATILGPRYLQYVIKEMKELLTRSYQVTTIACIIIMSDFLDMYTFSVLQFSLSL